MEIQSPPRSMIGSALQQPTITIIARQEYFVLSRTQQFFNYTKKGGKALAPVANAFYDCSVMALAAKDYSKKAFKDSPLAQLLFTLPVSLFAFGQSIGLNFSSTIEGIDETLDAIEDGKVPADWTQLSRRKEQLALVLGLTITMCVAYGDYCGGVFFFRPVPDDYEIEGDVNDNYWQLLCILTGVVAAITTAFTEGFDSYKALRHIVGGETTAVATTIPAKLCVPMIVFASLEAASETYAGIKNTTPGSSNYYLKYLLLIPSVAKIFSDFCFPGKLTLSAIDEFVLGAHDVITKTREEYVDAAKLRQLIWEARAEVSAFVSTTGAAVWVEYSQCALTDDLLVDEATKLPFNVSYFMRETLGWSATLRDGILQMATLYPLFLYISQKALTGDMTIHYHNSLMSNTLTFWRMRKNHKETGCETELEQLVKFSKPRYGSVQRDDMF
jgi:hypothetical protein